MTQPARQAGQLRAAHRDGVRLADVVATAALGGAYGLLYAFDRCALARVEDGALHEAVRTSAGYDSGPANLDGVYEARVFAEAGEIRWVRRGVEGLGTAAWVGEAPPPDGVGDEHDEVPEVVATLPTEYLLWGKATDRHPGPRWGEVAAAQVGALAVPLPQAAGTDVVVLHGREYLGEDVNGNVSVVEERLVGLSWAPSGGAA